jgi:hypothetical protein
LIRNESVSITIGGTQVYPTTISVTQGVGYGYNSCSVQGISLVGNVGDAVVLTINGQVFNFIVDEKNYSKNDRVSFTCKGSPVVLGDLVNKGVIYDYPDSDTLISTETANLSVSVVNNIPNIDFGNKSYSKDSTPLQRIKDMVDIVGGEMYEVGGVLQLDLLKRISDTPVIAYDFDSNLNTVVDFSYYDKRDSSTLVNEVLINPLVDTLESEPTVTLDLDGSSGTVYFNPSLSEDLPYSIVGLSASSATTSVVNEKFTLSSETSITTMGGIDSIDWITVNGVPIVETTDYVKYTPYNVIRFTAQQTGEVVIQYKTKSVSVYATQNTPFTITYQCSQIEDYIDLDSTNVVNSGECYGELVAPITYENSSKALVTVGEDIKLLFVEKRGATNKVTVGNYALSGGGNLTVEYLHSGTPWTETSFMSSISSAIVDRTEVTDGKVTYASELSKYVVYLDKPITSINDIYYGSEQLAGYSYNAGVDRPYIEFLSTDENKEVDISYECQFTEMTIPAPTYPHPVTLVDLIVCFGVATSEYTLAEETLCSLPTTFKIDVAGSFNKTITEVKGKVLGGDFGSLTVDSFGKVEVTVSTQAIQTITCDSIFSGSVIKVDSQGVV